MAEVVTMPDAATKEEVDFDVPLPKIVKADGTDNRQYTFALPINAIVRMEQELGTLNVSRISHLLRAVVWAAEAAGMHGVTERTVSQMFRGAVGMQKLQALVLELMGLKEVDVRSLAPFVPSPVEVIVAALDLAQMERGDRVLDPGCGDGRILELVCERGGYGVGHEINAERAALARERLARFTDRFEVHETDGREADFGQADIIFLYLLTESNNILRPLIEAKYKPGARVVSHDFIISGTGWMQTGHKAIRIDGDARIHNVYCYRYHPQQQQQQDA